MIRVCIVCEGMTEAEFVRTCMSRYFMGNGLNVFPVLLQAPSGGHRGGRVTVQRLVKFMSHQYHQTDRITTLVDFYGFQDRGTRSCEQLEQDIGEQLPESKYDKRFVLPYVQVHEFEGLLFSNPDAFKCVGDGWNQQVHEQLMDVRKEFPSPEDINGGRQSVPSKRILSIFGPGNYSKVVHGPLIAEVIGIDAMRRECPRFNAWIEKIAAWGK